MNGTPTEKVKSFLLVLFLRMVVALALLMAAFLILGIFTRCDPRIYCVGSLCGYPTGTEDYCRWINAKGGLTFFVCLGVFILILVLVMSAAMEKSVQKSKALAFVTCQSCGKKIDYRGRDIIYCQKCEKGKS